MSQSDTWRWADEKGEQRLVGADELRTAIVSGVLPPSTLVWREGMATWEPAHSVAEFADVARPGNGPPADAKAAEDPAESKGPPRTLLGLQAQQLRGVVLQEKRTPSVAPPRPAPTAPRPGMTKTLRPNVGPAIPAAPRLPAEAKPIAAPRPGLGTIRSPGAASPPCAATETKDWSFPDEETTNIPDKGDPVQPRPAPAAEPASARNPLGSRPQPIGPSVVRSAPPSSSRGEGIVHQETTESTTFQFAKNSLSLNIRRPSELTGDADKPPPGASAQTIDSSASPQSPPAPANVPDKPLAEPERKRSVGMKTLSLPPGFDDVPPTAPSPELRAVADDVPAYANKTTRMDRLPPPPMREPTATTMLPLGVEELPPSPADAAKKPHEVSRTIRLAADFLQKVFTPNPGRNDAANPPGALGDLLQIKPPPLPPPSADNGLSPQFVRLPTGTPHAATSLALRQVQPPAPAPAQIPLNALLASGALLILMVIGAFFVGRCSAKPAEKNVPAAKAGLAHALPVVPTPPVEAPAKACSLLTPPARWASVVGKNSPLALLALPSGKLAIGYAKDADEAVGIEVTPSTGQVEDDYKDKAKGDIERVTPVGKGYFVSLKETRGSLKSVLPIPGEKQFYVGIADEHIALADQPNGRTTRLWPLGSEEAAGLIRALPVPNRGHVLALRTTSKRHKRILAGYIGTDRKAASNLVQVTGSGGDVGEPMLGSNGRELAVVFADQASEQSGWKIRLGRAALGKVPPTTTTFELPPGGPGGEATTPAIVGLADGRWVMMWTEGSSGSRIVRAQTFGANFVAAGNPFVLSPSAGNFGPGALTVVGDYVTVVFVQKGKSNHELWGSVLQCG